MANVTEHYRRAQEGEKRQTTKLAEVRATLGIVAEGKAGVIAAWKAAGLPEPEFSTSAGALTVKGWVPRGAGPEPAGLRARSPPRFAPGAHPGDAARRPAAEPSRAAAPSLASLEGLSLGIRPVTAGASSIGELPDFNRINNWIRTAAPPKAGPGEPGSGAASDAGSEAAPEAGGELPAGQLPAGQLLAVVRALAEKVERADRQARDRDRDRAIEANLADAVDRMARAVTGHIQAIRGVQEDQREALLGLEELIGKRTDEALHKAYAAVQETGDLFKDRLEALEDQLAAHCLTCAPKRTARHEATAKHAARASNVNPAAEFAHLTRRLQEDRGAGASEDDEDGEADDAGEEEGARALPKINGDLMGLAAALGVPPPRAGTAATLPPAKSHGDGTTDLVLRFRDDPEAADGETESIGYRVEVTLGNPSHIRVTAEEGGRVWEALADEPTHAYRAWKRRAKAKRASQHEAAPLALAALALAYAEGNQPGSEGVVGAALAALGDTSALAAKTLSQRVTSDLAGVLDVIAPKVQAPAPPDGARVVLGPLETAGDAAEREVTWGHYRARAELPGGNREAYVEVTEGGGPPVLKGEPGLLYRAAKARGLDPAGRDGEFRESAAVMVALAGLAAAYAQREIPGGDGAIGAALHALAAPGH